MADRLHRPMALAEWRTALLRHGQACTHATLADGADCLRGLHALLLRAPGSAFLAGATVPDDMDFERLLLAGAEETAAFALLGDDCGYMLSRGGDGECLASIVLPGRSEEQSAAALSPALALSAAMCQALAHPWVGMSDAAGANGRSPFLLN